MKSIIFWTTSPLTFLLLIVADILGSMCESYVDAFNRYEAWARGYNDVDEHADVLSCGKVYNEWP